MKITAIKSWVVNAYRGNYVFATIETDEGIVGVGEGTVESRAPTVAEAINEIGRYLVGQDPFDIERHCQIINRDSYYRTGIILRSALSAVEAAMFDIKGKALGVPVYQLIGGQYRDRIPCYANGWFAGAKTPEQFAERAVWAVGQGFRGLKWDPFGKAYMTMDAAERNNAVANVRAVREAVGDDIDLMIEAHGRLNVPTAIYMAEALAEFKPVWLEEPIPPESIQAMLEVKRRSPIPIACGERYYETFRFAELLEAGAADYWQPDVSHVGGISAMQKIAHLAETRYIPIAPHNPIGPVANAMTLHFAAATANVVVLETMATDVPWRGEITDEDVIMEDGCMLIPNRPGLGIELNEAECLKHPYKEPLTGRHYSGELTNIRPPDQRPFYRTAS